MKTELTQKYNYPKLTYVSYFNKILTTDWFRSLKIERSSLRDTELLQAKSLGRI